MSGSARTILSQSGKKFVDWGRVIAHLGPEMKKPVAETVSYNSELVRLIRETSASLPTLDWALYEKVLLKGENSEATAFLQECKKKVEQFRPVKKDPREALAAMEQETVVLMKKADEFHADLEKNIAFLEEQTKKFQAMKPIDEMTMEDIYEWKPEWKTEFDQRIRDDFWAFEKSPEDLRAFEAELAAHH